MSQAGLITSSNGVFVGSPVTFQAYLTSPQSCAGGSTGVTVIFDTTTSNVGSGYDTSTGVFTAPTTGFYGFTTTVFFNNLTTPVGNTEAILGYTGSVQSLRLFQQGSASYVGISLILTGSWTMPMTAGDTVKIQPFADGAGNYQLLGDPESSSAFNTTSTFSGWRIA